MKTQAGLANHWILSIMAATLLAGCSKKEYVEPAPAPAPGGAVEITLNGRIASGTVTAAASTAALAPPTRAVIDEDYAADLEVNFARLDQGSSDGTYPGYGTVTALGALRKGNASGTTGETEITFDVPQYYLTHDTYDQTKLVGWYPRAAVAADGSVSFAVTGESDIMLTGELTGDKADGNRFGENTKIFTFEHKLTQLKVSAYAADAAASDKWGTISANGIKIKAQAPTCKVTLPAAVAFEGTAVDLVLPAKKAVGDGAIAYPLTLGVAADASTTNAVECGYAMVGPVKAAASGGSLTLTVTTAKGGTRDVALTLPAAGFEAGKAYDVVLKFSATAITPQAQIGKWESVADKIEIEM